MASIKLDPAGSGFYRIQFRYGGRQFNKSLKIRSEQEAAAIAGRVEETLALLRRGRLSIPEGADVGSFILSDGKLTGRPILPKTTEALSLDRLIHLYQESPPPSKEAGTVRGER